MSNSPKVHISNLQKDLKIAFPSVRKVVRAILSSERIACKEIALYFVTEKRISKLHKDFFNDPTPTDCISFPMDQEFLGEVFVCPKTAQIFAKKNNLDPYPETTLYIIHGILHLLGYDDLAPAKKRIMRKKEKTCMALLEEHNLFLHS